MPDMVKYNGAYRFNFYIYAALVAIAWLVNYPGRLNPDTLDMLNQAQNLSILTDWHAPILTWLFSLFTPILGQPGGALLVQALLVCSYPALVPVGRDDRRINIADALLAAAAGIFTAALIAISGQILKDVVLIGAVLTLLCLLDQRSVSSEHKGLWLLSKLALLLIIFAARPTNFLMLAIAGGICAIFIFGAGRKFLLAVLVIFIVCAGGGGPSPH